MGVDIVRGAGVVLAEQTKEEVLECRLTTVDGPARGRRGSVQEI